MKTFEDYTGITATEHLSGHLLLTSRLYGDIAKAFNDYAIKIVELEKRIEELEGKLSNNN